MEQVGVIQGANNIVTAVHNHAGNIGEFMGIAQNLIFFQKVLRSMHLHHQIAALHTVVEVEFSLVVIQLFLHPHLINGEKYYYPLCCVGGKEEGTEEVVTLVNFCSNIQLSDNM